jgi:hypothetical protein
VFGHVAVEHEEHMVARADAIGEIEAERSEAHHVRIEGAHRVLGGRVAVKDRLEHALQPWPFDRHLRMMLHVRRVPRPDRKELVMAKGSVN